MWRLIYAVHHADDYIIHTLTSILSALKCFGKTKFTIHILHNGTIENKWLVAINKIECKFSTSITLHKMPRLDQSVVDMCGKFSEASLYRIFIPELFDDGFAVYADSDICFHVGFDQLVSFTLKSDSFALGVVKDAHSFVTQMFAYLSEKNLDPHRYFNSGLLVFNIQNMKSAFPDLSRNVLKILRQHENLAYPDQDALNILFNRESGATLKDALIYMPEKFNFNILRKKKFMYTPSLLENVNIHYAGIKPWQDAYPASIYYWRNREELCSVCGFRL